MNIDVTLFGGLRQYLPPGSAFNRCTLRVADDASLRSLLAQVPIPDDRPFLVILNDEKVDPADYDDIRIGSDDSIVLLPPIKGG